MGKRTCVFPILQRIFRHALPAGIGSKSYAGMQRRWQMRWLRSPHGSCRPRLILRALAPDWSSGARRRLRLLQRRTSSRSPVSARLVPDLPFAGSFWEEIER